ncbi:unnamed protein product [Mycena citricolor]|uniref:WIBG Mago-binding domain-containing protein n=1 Tax=Mycena citricolor TaxID=2018698 RepID=A0AAD2HF93_9AGAR|nr:unnamed protein product [Mycena citricolor]
MSLPPLNPQKTAAGITVDPQTLDRVIPESRRADGTVRKQIKIRPGFTPQEDVRRFRGTRQAQADANALPKGHIIGWVPPTAAQTTATAKPLSKSAKKNAKRRDAKRDEKKEVVAEDWEDDAEEDPSPVPAPAKAAPPTSTSNSAHSTDRPNWAAAPEEALTAKLAQLDVK